MMMEIYGSGGTTYDKTTTTLSDAQKGHPLPATSNKENSFDLWNRDLLCPFGNQQTEALEHLSRGKNLARFQLYCYCVLSYMLWYQGQRFTTTMRGMDKRRYTRFQQTINE